MSQPSPTPPVSAEIDRLQRELADKTELVQHVREELIRSQISVLELQDTILQKETDKADAVAILGQAELVLEGKINYIVELDRVLNERIAAAQQELAAARAAHEAVIADLVQKLDQTNRDLGATHTLAANYARDAAHASEKLATITSALERLNATQAETSAQLSAANADIESLRDRLDATSAARDDLQQKLTAIHRSFAWKITAPLRALSRRKL
jgi:chromosome segregation ATPase